MEQVDYVDEAAWKLDDLVEQAERLLGSADYRRKDGGVRANCRRGRGVVRRTRQLDRLLKRRPCPVFVALERECIRLAELLQSVCPRRRPDERENRVADATILFNNAGVAGTVGTSITDPDALAHARYEMEVNYFGVLALSSAFAPVLARNGGGAVVNMASVAGLVNFPLFQTYSASKAAVHSVTQALRTGLSGQGTFVAGVYPGPVDTEMARGVPMDKTLPNEVASAILQSLESGADEIFPDPVSQQMGAMFLEDPKGMERATAAMAAGDQAA